jgi:SET domain-containing protein
MDRHDRYRNGVDKSIYHYDSGHDDPFLDYVITLISPSTITIAAMTIPS